MRKKIIMLLLMSTFLCTLVAQTINLDGSWNPTLSTSDMIKEAGLDYDSNIAFESSFNQFLLSLVHAPWRSWHVDVSCTFYGFTSVTPKIEIRRTGNGDTTVGTIYNGYNSNYLQLETIDQKFIYGTWDYNDIPIQYKITGDFSVLNPVEPNQIVVTYTIISGW